jgi:4-alpha-glucanotransferase
MLQLTSPASDFYAGITFHYYVQYLLHLQLSDVAKHAEDKGVGLAVLVQKY